MRIEITEFFRRGNPKAYAASAHEIGQNAGHITWSNAMRDAGHYPLLASSDAQSAMVDYLRATGGWSAEECEAFSGQQLTALCLQFVSGDIRQGQVTCADGIALWSWEHYYSLCESGHVAGRLSHDEQGRVFYDLGN